MEYDLISDSSSDTAFIGFEDSDIFMHKLSVMSDMAGKVLPFRVDKLIGLSPELKKQALDCINKIPSGSKDFVIVYNPLSQTITLEASSIILDKRTLSQVIGSSDFVGYYSGEGSSSYGLGNPPTDYAEPSGSDPSKCGSTGVSNKLRSAAGVTSPEKVSGPLDDIASSAASSGHLSEGVKFGSRTLESALNTAGSFSMENVALNKGNFDAFSSGFINIDSGNGRLDNRSIEATERDVFLANLTQVKRKYDDDSSDPVKRSSGYGVKATYVPGSDLDANNIDCPNTSSSDSFNERVLHCLEEMRTHMGSFQSQLSFFGKAYSDNNVTISQHLVDLKQDFSAKLEAINAQFLENNESGFNLVIPEEELWTGCFRGSDYFFVDDYGFGLCLNSQEDTFELIDMIYDVSSFEGKPRSPYCSSILTRFHYCSDLVPLYKLSTKGSEPIVISDIGLPDSKSQVINPWALSAFDNMPSALPLPKVDPPVKSKGKKRAPLSTEKFKAAQVFLDVLNNARDKAISHADDAAASMYSNMCQYLSDESSKDTYGRNWPLVLDSIKKIDPNAFLEIQSATPSSGQQFESAPKVRFTEGNFFNEYLHYFSGMLDGSVNAFGKRVTDVNPLPVGKWLPSGLNRASRFYKHGTKNHLCHEASPQALNLLSSVLKDNFNSSSLVIPHSLSKSFASNISLLREISSTQKRVLDIITEDVNFDVLSEASKAAAFSLNKSIVDGMTVASSIHSNFMLAHREKFLRQLPSFLLKSRPELGPLIRTAHLNGPLVPDHVVNAIKEVKKELPKPIFKPNFVKSANLVPISQNRVSPAGSNKFIPPATVKPFRGFSRGARGRARGRGNRSRGKY